MQKVVNYADCNQSSLSVSQSNSHERVSLLLRIVSGTDKIATLSFSTAIRHKTLGKKLNGSLKTTKKMRFFMPVKIVALMSALSLFFVVRANKMKKKEKKARRKIKYRAAMEKFYDP